MAQLDYNTLFRGFSDNPIQGLNQQLQQAGPIAQYMQQQRQSEQQADIFNRNIRPNEQGVMQLDKPSALAQLYGVNPDAAAGFESKWADNAPSQKQFANLLKVDSEGFYRRFNPNSQTFDYQTDESGHPVKAQQNYGTLEGEQGVYSVNKNTGETKPLEGITPKGTAKTKSDIAKAKVDMQKSFKEMTKMDFDMEQKSKELAQGGQFKQNQYKAALFGNRIANAIGTMDSLANAGFDRSKLEYGSISKLPSYFQDPALQSQIQAERNFVTATLRPESGASIAPSEFKDAEKIYFPRSGDSPEVIATKAQNRNIVLSALQAESGGAWQQLQDKMQQGKASGGPKVGAVVNGYIFKGGNTKDKSNWEKVK